MHNTIGATPTERAYISRVIDQANRAARDYFAAADSVLTTTWPAPPPMPPSKPKSELHRFIEGGFIEL